MLSIRGLRHFYLVMLAASVGWWNGSVAAFDREKEPADLPRIQVVLFTPSDVEPPAGHEERLTQIADYTEKFLFTWMRHWKYPATRDHLFDRAEDGRLVIRCVRGRQPATSADYLLPSLVNEARATAIARYNIPQHLHIWWVHVYLGPEREYKDYRGSGTSRFGGSSVARYWAAPGTIDLAQPILAGFHESYHLKGVIHELGHALGLQHLGPRRDQPYGNTLMGPNQFEWNQHMKQREPRAYLCDAEAAMLYRHPLFSGSTEDRKVIPKLTVSGLDCRFDAAQKRVRVSGHLHSEMHAHTAIVIDESSSSPSNYWRKAYTGRIQDDGGFTVGVTELNATDGTLKIVFCFDNGVHSGDGKGDDFTSAISKSYRYRNRRLEFEK